MLCFGDKDEEVTRGAHVLIRQDPNEEEDDESLIMTDMELSEV
jgi:hypothetical protein